jgi:hypothetical protein
MEAGKGSFHRTKGKGRMQERRYLFGFGMKAGLLFVLLAIAAATAVFAASRQTSRQKSAKPPAKSAEFTAKPTPARLARGRYLVENVAGCFHCHTVHEYVNGQWIHKHGMLGAGAVFPPGFIPLPPGAQVVASNITPDRETGIGSWTDVDIQRALQKGIAKDGRPLFNLMPYWQYSVFTPEDVKSIIVYLRSIPPVHNALPVTKMPFPVTVDTNKALIPPLPKNASAEVRRGWYLTRVSGCEDCHTPIVKGRMLPSLMFAGGMHFQGPFGNLFSLNITPDDSGIGFMDEAAFTLTLTTGRVNGTGTALNSFMPFDSYRNMKPGDLRAIYAYLHTVPKIRHEIDNTDPPTYCPLDGEKHGLGDSNEKQQ